ncbi:acyl-CoA dehydrogenase/oxidase [Fimicolochytrium jonesii]|uniref:acyl-CoA dehydrogenase/oxidase n=1 Tax=Fimicolochytrium jonesii TaxID=1396493 RepID=UPI0022FE1479|nr:acyl-CoA dehydrogenase/oxidase [Fimicolochytrium jonesii]KAI8827044.1 acyl-CoA dehydrogenase/oxidase [Fimicolochytrium jonesii]
MIAGLFRSNLAGVARPAVCLRLAPVRRFSAAALAQPITRNEASPTNSLYNFTEEETMLRETVRKFALETVKPLVYEMDEKEAMPKALFDSMFEQGLMGIETPDDLGGSGMSFTAAILAVEELARVDASVSAACDIHNTLVNTVFRQHASDALKEKYLARLATDTVGSFCLTEAGAGSDAFALSTTATKKGNKYILNGGKMWITNSAEAGIFLVFANVDPSKGYKGITCFAVEKEMGVKINKKEKKLGIRSSSTCELSFDDIEVPEENIIGEIGKGYKYAIEILNEGRIGIAAQMIGIAQGSLDIAVPYMQQRKQFGTSIIDFQGIEHQLAQVATELEAARLLTYNAARLKEEGRDFVKQAAMAKLYACQVAEKSASKAIEWVGGVGFTRDFGIEKFYRDAKIGAIYEGTSNMQLQTIAKILKKEY